MNIRKATITDTQRIAEIHVESWQAAYKEALPADFLASLNLQRREAMWRSCVESDGRLFVLEGEGSKVIGFLSVSDPRDNDIENATELTAIYLDPKFYGTGIGSAFWRDIERDLTTDCVYLWVLAANLLGIAFYKKNGFRPDGTKKSFKIGEQEFEELRYRKALHNQSVLSTPRAAPSPR